MDNIGQGLYGMNLDSLPQQVQVGGLSYALNAVVEGFSNNMGITYSNDRGNTLCITLPDGYKTIACYNITNISTIVFFLTNPDTGDSEIGTVLWDTCTYTTLISDKDNDCKFGWSIDKPIRKIEQKTTNCSTQLYWADPIRRYIDLDDLPWVEEIDPQNSFKRIKVVGKLDCNKLNVQPNYSIPELEPLEVSIGGELVMGTYQFAVQYANALGDGYTSYYNVTNPLGIFENKFTGDFNLPTSKAINIKISNLDTTGLYEYFNLAVIKTINNITTVELVATLPITSHQYTYNYTGSNKSPLKLDIKDIFEKFPYYSAAGDVFSVDNIIGWGILTEQDNLNYQKIWSQVKLQWETYQIPYNVFEGYSNGVNTANYRGYMRDEVYAFEGCFVLRNGKQTRSFHIPGRIYTESDKDLVPVSNSDNAFSYINPCDEPRAKEKWQVYNTGSIVGYTEEWINKTTSDDCYVGPYEFGEMAYWESELKYPNNREIWGDLANNPIRHHKFPDSAITPIFDNNPNQADPNRIETYKSFEHKIYPIGIKVIAGSLQDAINSSSLSKEQKDDIIGFKITRGNRATNKSVIAKGILHNVGHAVSLEDDNTTKLNDYYYANYTYNDLNTDPYFASTKLVSHEGFNYSRGIQGFADEDNKERFVFHSPDTHFFKPSLDNQGEYLNLYNIYYGKSYSHFVKVKDNAEYKFLTPNTIYAAAAIAIAGGFTIGAGSFGSPTFSAGNVASSYEGASELFNKLVPYENFGYSFNSVGYYGNQYPIPNEGNKVRGITFNRYVKDGIQNIEEGKLLNNTGRESAVYIKTNENVLFPHEYAPEIPEDVSRYNVSSLNNDTPPSTVPQFISQYRLHIDYVSGGQMPVGTIYTINGRNYRVAYTFLNFNFLDKTHPNPYSGDVFLFDIDSYAPVIPPLTGSGSFNSALSTVDPTKFGGFVFRFDYVSSETLLVENPAYVASKLDKKSIAQVRSKDISSYYGAIKKYLPAQWGEMYSYETIDTGFFHLLKDSDNNSYTSFPAVFGGDIFINRFAYKSKLPFFNDNTVKGYNQQDISYDELGTLGWPMFWLSTKPSSFNIDIASQVQVVADELFSPSAGSVILNIISGALVGTSKIQKLFRQIFREIYSKIGIKNLNLDQSYIEGISEQGLMYLFAYGAPYFFCESEVNVDYRQAYNEREGNFFPNVSTGIPDDWFQEVNVPITYDNTYTYNQTYSKQNKENFFAHLREDYDPAKLCLTEHPNRAIWSDQSSLEETKNNWLVYRPSSYYDFPKTYGDLISIDNLEHNQLLVRFQNRSQIYNALTTVDVTNGLNAYLGNAKLFSGTPPLDLSNTTTGYAGSQHQMLLKTEFGHVFVDSLRGQVILLSGSNITDLAEADTDKFFSEFLPFRLREQYPTVPIDNAFNKIGITATYDTYYKRIILTKIDYEAIKTVYFDEVTNNFYSDPNLSEYISLSNTEYFANRSFTISYSFKTQKWISFHSFVPNYYIPFPNYFYTGVNSNGSVWEHNKTFELFNNYYGSLCPYILEYPYAYKYLDEITQSIKDYTECRVYTDFYTYHTPDEITYFNEAILYNNQQCTGTLNLIPKAKNNMSQMFSYPKYNTNSKDIIVSKSDNFYNFNQFWDIVKSNNTPFLKTTSNFSVTDKELIDSNLDYSQRNFKKNLMRGKNLYLRLTLNSRDNICLISHFNVIKTSESYK